MAQRIPLALGKTSEQARAPMESVERLINAYVEAQPQGKEPTPIYGTPGLALYKTGLNGAVRGMLSTPTYLYVVAGTHLYEVKDDGTATDAGSIPGTLNVAMATDGVSVVVVPQSGTIYVYNGALTTVTDPDAPAASSVVWLDGFFIFGELGDDTWFISALNDPTSYDALDFATAEWKPDRLLTPVIHRDTLYLFGTESLQAEQNVGGADFPFQEYRDLKVDVGLAGREAVVTTNDTVFWLANDFTVRRLDGITATPVSTPAIARLIKAWSDASLTVASAYVWDQHLFVVFRNPDGCVCFDQTTSLWHERQSAALNTWRVNFHAEQFGFHFWGSASEGKFYRMEDDVWAEDGATLPFRIVTPFVYAQNRRVSVTELEVVAQTGVGTAGNAAITCRRTKDGATWSPAKTRNLGNAAQGNGRVRFGLQGMGRAMAFELGIDAPVQRAIFGIYADADIEA